MKRIICKIEKKPQQPKLMRVAAYARVSSGKEAMLHSLATQVHYYQQMIENHAGWKFCGVFADEAITGTKDNRENFQKLLDKCHRKELDMVITKSISRFARNTVTLLETVRELKRLGVDVYFEEQNIHSISNDGELLLTILASYAQEESKSASDNIRVRIQHNFLEGKPWNATVLGYRYVEGVYELVPEEAEIVRFIFESYLNGWGTQKIANALNQMETITRKECCWHKNSVLKILKNYTYTGNLLLQKTFVKDHISKENCINHGERKKYHAEETHVPIISLEQYKRVQEEIKRRTEKYDYSAGRKNTYPFSGKLICNNCGKHYQRKKTSTGYVWICSTFNHEGKSACASKQIPESELERMSAEVLGIPLFDAALFQEQITSITICDECNIVFRMQNGGEIEKTWKVRSRAESWTEEMKQKERERNAKNHSHPIDH